MKEAEDWFACMNSGEASNSDRAAFAQWRLEDESHRVAFEKVEALWGRTASVANDPAIQMLRDSALANSAMQNTNTQTIKTTITSHWVSIAAALFLVVVVSSFMLTGQSGFWTNSPTEYASVIGEQKTILLADGSTVRLDTASRIEVDYTVDERTIELRAGRARFQVAHDPARPFVVKSGSGSITALGTAFDVRRSDHNTVVVLLEGKVEVVTTISADPEVVQLKPGQQVAYRPNGKLLELAVVDLEVMNSWAEGRLVFKGDLLKDALTEVNRYSNRKIVLADAVFENERFRGTFNVGDVESVVLALSRLYGLQADFSVPDKIMLVQE